MRSELMPWRWRTVQKLSILALSLVAVFLGTIIGWLLVMAIRS
jgi:hypothetical protein